MVALTGTDGHVSGLVVDQYAVEIRSISSAGGQSGRLVDHDLGRWDRVAEVPQQADSGGAPPIIAMRTRASSPRFEGVA